MEAYALFDPRFVFKTIVEIEEPRLIGPRITTLDTLDAWNVFAEMQKSNVDVIGQLKSPGGSSMIGGVKWGSSGAFKNFVKRLASVKSQVSLTRIERTTRDFTIRFEVLS